MAYGAAFEDRIAACVLYNGVDDGYDAFASGFPQSLRTAVELLIFYLDDCNANLRSNMKHGMWTTGTSSPFELIQGSKKYTVKVSHKK